MGAADAHPETGIGNPLNPESAQVALKAFMAALYNSDLPPFR